MTLKNAINHFNRLVSETTKKSEIKVYQDFIHILTSLEKRNLTESEVQSIEAELDALDLINGNPTNRKRHFNKAIQLFKKYLMDTFSLITKGYYTNLGIALGSSLGLLFGIVFLSSLERSLGISLGISVGAQTKLSLSGKCEAHFLIDDFNEFIFLGTHVQGSQI